MICRWRSGLEQLCVVVRSHALSHSTTRGALTQSYRRGASIYMRDKNRNSVELSRAKEGRGLLSPHVFLPSPPHPRQPKP